MSKLGTYPQPASCSLVPFQQSLLVPLWKTCSVQAVGSVFKGLHGVVRFLTRPEEALLPSIINAGWPNPVDKFR